MGTTTVLPISHYSMIIGRNRFRFSFAIVKNSAVVHSSEGERKLYVRTHVFNDLSESILVFLAGQK